jgi:ubiquinone/menaquinone biosynthesis C-methylase UbiE
VSRAQVGEAGFLDFKDQAFDHALLLGPLYHLQQHTERLAALTEARRVLKPGGFLFAAGITRFASAIDGLYNGTIDDPAFGQIVTVDLETGRHSNTTGNPKYFTTAYFHRPDELASELSAAGFQNVEVFAVEGVSWAAPDLDDRVADPVKLAAMLDLLRRLESEPSILGASPHFLAVGRA